MKLIKNANFFSIAQTALSVSVVTVGSLAVSSLSTQAAPVVFFDNMFTGATDFDSIVNSVNGDLTIDTWTNLPQGQTMIDRGAYSFRKVNNAAMFPSVYTLFNSSPLTTTSGETININPSSTDVEASRLGSAIEFTFDSPVNGFGLEVGDWATCCQPSNLYISFDGGTPILVGESLVFGDQFLTNGGAGVFVGAIDDSGTFSTVQFWGDGQGEFLVAGGEIRYATVEEGSVTGVPEPATVLGLLTIGAFGVGSSALKKANYKRNKKA
ncbi:PEP-CTERM sorting domain-containing protein [Crocosphaera sp. UHCC 0190]|uniref:PEP-CTERM sorting domain-containing protein n=1 Tax=Crocosphaera sp. UHCC 0190 TaxID=3110246 RepID=UPI002B201208|nr:PEP-CTERM sorting domain-containing protein [Crocosphaera sp. UHCC 0190]MEA5510859.1 PEP-CTERM sorting domain-containing protein [Crocosphaera sp. UHCC 0190]